MKLPFKFYVRNLMGVMLWIPGEVNSTDLEERHYNLGEHEWKNWGHVRRSAEKVKEYCAYILLDYQNAAGIVAQIDVIENVTITYRDTNIVVPPNPQPDVTMLLCQMVDDFPEYFVKGPPTSVISVKLLNGQYRLDKLVMLNYEFWPAVTLVPQEKRIHICRLIMHNLHDIPYDIFEVVFAIVEIVYVGHTSASLPFRVTSLLCTVRGVRQQIQMLPQRLIRAHSNTRNHFVHQLLSTDGQNPPFTINQDAVEIKDWELD